MMPIVNVEMESQLSIFVTIANVVFSLKSISLYLPSKLSRCSLSACWLVMNDESIANNDTSKKHQDVYKNSLQIGLDAIFSVNVIDNPIAPAESVNMALSKVEAAVDSNSINNFRSVRYSCRSGGSLPLPIFYTVHFHDALMAQIFLYNRNCVHTQSFVTIYNRVYSIFSY